MFLPPPHALTLKNFPSSTHRKPFFWFKNGYLFIYVKMKENIHILEILKQISKLKSNVKMKKSKVFDHP
jgi:hypothetical protein